MVKIVMVQVVKVVVTIVATISVVYFSLRSLAGDPELVRRGFIAADPSAQVAASVTVDRASDSAAGDHIGRRRLAALARAYPRWLLQALSWRFDRSYYSDLHPFRLIGAQIGRTTLLALASFIVCLLGAVGLAVLRARHPTRLLGAVLTLGSRLIMAIPEFWLAMLLLFGLAIAVPLFPLFGAASAMHYVLPLLALALSRGAVMFSILDAEMRRQAQSECVLFARARHLSSWWIVYRYQLRNALPVLIPIGAIQFGYLFGGAVIVEQVFGISGFGTLLLQALQRRDYPVAEASAYVVALLFALLGIAADVLRVAVDPRLRSHHTERRLSALAS